MTTIANIRVGDTRTHVPPGLPIERAGGKGGRGCAGGRRCERRRHAAAEQQNGAAPGVFGVGQPLKVERLKSVGGVVEGGGSGPTRFCLCREGGGPDGLGTHNSVELEQAFASLIGEEALKIDPTRETEQGVGRGVQKID